MKKLLDFLKKLFSLDYSSDIDVYDIKDEDIEAFFNHLRSSGKIEYTMAYFYKWHREYRKNNQLR